MSAYTKDMLFAQLKELGVPQNKPVTIHTSLRNIGEVEGRAEGLLDVLIEYITAEGGLLCVPTHTHCNLRKYDSITLDLCNPTTNIGTFPLIATCDSRGIHSLNPSHSMTIFGEEEAARRFAACDDAIETCTSPEGCYGELCRQDGYVLLAGVGQNRNTYLHCVEEMLGLPDRLSPDYIDTTVRLLDGTVFHHPIRVYRPTPEVGDISRWFPEYEPAFRAHGCIADGWLGNAKAQLCSAAGMAEVAKMIFERSGGRDLLVQDNVIEARYYR